MYVIGVYDIGVKRITKVHNVMKQYLNWIQNSVFEGEITQGLLKELKMKLNSIIDEEEDSVFLFTCVKKDLLKKEILGLEKSDISNIL